MSPVNEIPYETLSILELSESERMVLCAALIYTLGQLRYDHGKFRYYAPGTFPCNSGVVFYPEELEALECLTGRIAGDEGGDLCPDE